MTELRGLMSKMLIHDQRMTLRLPNVNWTRQDNAGFRDVVSQLITTCKTAFSTRMNLSNITALTLGSTESFSVYLAQLTAAFDLLYEMHPEEHFLGRLKAEIAAGVKKTCISWKTASLQEILHHAEHTEDQLSE